MIRVIGLGSPFGDDQAGWRTTDALRDRLPAGCDLHALDRPGAALINWMPDTEQLILIDAVRSGARPGSLYRVDPVALVAQHGRLSSHQLALRDTLRLARSLGCLPGRIAIYGIEIGQTDGPRMSAAVASAVDRLVPLIVRDLRRSVQTADRSSDASTA